MGSPVPTVITYIFVEDLEGKIFKERVESPGVWKRFVDDVLAVVKKNYGNMLLENMRTSHLHRRKKLMTRCPSWM